ncbi:MAG: hypothetical protein ACOCWM_05060 [Cyclobacteriaceae bacterium]
MTEQELLDLKEEINEAKQKRDKLEGRLEQLTETLKTKFKVNDVKSADKMKEEMKTEIDKLDEQIEKRTKELEEKYL